MKFKIPFTSFEITRAKEKNNIFGGNVNHRLPFQDDSIIINSETFYKIYKGNGDIYSCVRELSENVGAAGWDMVDKNDKQKEVPMQDYLKIQSILSFSQSWQCHKRDLVRDMEISGNAYWHLVRSKDGSNILGIDRIDPRQMAIVATESGDIIAYLQHVKGRPIKYSPDEIIHFAQATDFDSPLFGFSPLHSVVVEALTDNEAALSNYVFFKNDAQPTVFYVLDDNLAENERRSAVELIRDQHKGTKNRHKSTALSGVKDIKKLTDSQKDMEFLGGRRFSTEKICASYGVPKFLLGYTETTNNNNGTELLKKFYQGTIQPKETDIEYTMTNKLLQAVFKHDKYEFIFLPQLFDEQESLERRGLAELQMAAITRRQYKIKTGQEITEEDEREENFDKYILPGGAGATLLADVGLDFNPIDISEDDTTE